MNRALLFLLALSTVTAFGEVLTEWKDEIFIEHESGALAMDIVRPADEEKRPAVICLHGGFWVKGSKENIYQIAEDLADLGYVGISASYRLTGVAPFPAQLEDVRAAIRYLRENATKYHIDPDRIGIIGSSAGGHLAVLSAVEGNCESIERPNAAVGMGAQSDLTSPHIQNIANGSAAENWSKFMGDIYSRVPDAYAKASPVTYLSGDDAPVALICGEFDHSSTRGERFRRAAFRPGIPTGLTEIKGGPHSLIRKEEFRSQAVAAIDHFFNLYLGDYTAPLVVDIEPDSAWSIEPTSESWQVIGGGYGGCEGAQWIRMGEVKEPELVFAAHHDHLLFRWSKPAGLRLWEEGTAELSTLRPTRGGFYGVEQQTRCLIQKKLNPPTSIVLAEKFEGKRLNRPNDLRIRPGKGTVWFTDPDFLFRTRPLETKELPGQYVFHYDPDTQTLTTPIRDLELPNGIAFNRSGSKLYIGDSRAKTLFRYDLNDAGKIESEPFELAKFEKGLDGVSLAPDNHIWVATPTGVVVLTPAGEKVAHLPMPDRCTSIDFIEEGDHHLVAVTTRSAAQVAKLRFPMAK